MRHNDDDVLQDSHTSEAPQRAAGSWTSTLEALEHRASAALWMVWKR